MHVWPEEPEFLALIQSRPCDDGPRLIFADYLDEHQDPRGELIRLQCALARLPADDVRRAGLQARESAWHRQFDRDWIGPIAQVVADAQFRRGILDSVSMSAERFLEQGEALFRFAPIRRVRLYDVGPRFGEIMQAPHLAEVRELDLCGNDLGNGGMMLITRSPYLEQLESLDLSFNALSGPGLRLLAESGKLSRLQALYLNDNGRINHVGIESLARTARLSQLRVLDLSGNDLSDAAVRMLTDSSVLRRLDRLVLHHNPIGDMGFHWLLQNESWFRLLRGDRTLNLEDCSISVPGISELAQSPRLASIETLELSGNLLSDRGVAELARSPHCKRLRHLHLHKNRLTDQAAIALADAPWLAQLETLDLAENGFTSHAVEIIQRSPYHHWRLKLDLVDLRDQLPQSVRSSR